MNIPQIEQQIKEEFSFLEDWQEKYQYLIDLGKTLPAIATEDKSTQFLIKGCQSQVWLIPEFKDGKVFFNADSDAIITKGIIALLIRIFSGQTPEDILLSQVNFINEIGLKEHLSPTRANGLVSMIEQIKLYAQAYTLMSK